MVNSPTTALKTRGNVDHWIKQEVKFEDFGGITDATSCDGKIYGLTCRFDDILIIEAVDTTTLTVKKMGIESWLPSLKESLPISVVLVESSGKLYAIRRIYAEQYKPQEIQDFEVFKLHFSRKSWERVKSLGNHASFWDYLDRSKAIEQQIELFLRSKEPSGGPEVHDNSYPESSHNHTKTHKVLSCRGVFILLILYGHASVTVPTTVKQKQQDTSNPVNSAPLPVEIVDRTAHSVSPMISQAAKSSSSPQSKLNLLIFIARNHLHTLSLLTVFTLQVLNIFKSEEK
ncbi:hypothetical protein LguiB_020906 [Lonicera macranthoides]